MKKFVAGVVALSIAFGGLALPAESGFAAGSASAEEMSEDYATNEEISPDDGEAYIAEQSGEDVQVAGAILTYGDFNYTVLDDGTVEITSYNGSDDDVVIPSKIKGKKVTSIGAWAFEEYIQGPGFNIKSVVIPDTVTSIGSEAFGNCENLKKVTLPSSVTSIGTYAFSGTPWLEALKKNNTFVVVNNILLDATSAEGEVTIPGGVVTIAGGAFAEANITNVNFPDSVKYINAWAFKECTKLNHVVLPKNLVSIDGAFNTCYNLISIVIPKSVKTIGIQTFYYCTSLKAVYYTGSEEEWNNISTGDPYNPFPCDQELKNAKIHFNYDYSQPILDIIADYFNRDADGVKKGTSLRFHWVTAPDADGYKFYIYNSSTKKWVNKGTVRDGKGEYFELYNLTPGTTYKYRVRAYAKRNGKTYWGDYSNGTAMTTPGKAVIKSTSSTKNSITLKWGKVKSADGYRVYRYDSKTKKWKKLATVKNGKTSYVDKKSLKSKTTYKYKVKAYHKWMYGGTFWGDASAVKSVKTK
ncbi:fibronectin type III domain protein [Ruminococcus sp. CAG:579]|nr:fibronectin type III domain protein [Ruminococcus sp. CAG:579]